MSEHSIIYYFYEKNYYLTVPGTVLVILNVLCCWLFQGRFLVMSVLHVVTLGSNPIQLEHRLSGLLAALLVGCQPLYTDASTFVLYASCFVGMSLPSIAKGNHSQSTI